jgi:hypothetical protein
MSRGTGSSSEFPVQNGFLEQSGPRRRVIRMTRPRTAAERMATAVERTAAAKRIALAVAWVLEHSRPGDATGDGG